MAKDQAKRTGFGDRFPNSKKVYKTGSRDDVRVPFREVTIDRPTSKQDGTGEDRASHWMYDPSGPWTDPEVELDVNRGLPAVRLPWIEERGDTETYSGHTSFEPGTPLGDEPRPRPFEGMKPWRRRRSDLWR